MKNVILQPILTEKMTAVTEKYNRYGFIVNKKATKTEIKAAIKSIYGVDTDAINTMNYGGGKKKTKYTNKGIIYQKNKSFKKAIVTLKEGDVIDLYENI